MNNELVIIMCPPYPEYQSPPGDQSTSELFDCPKCDNKMWLSQKKKSGLLLLSRAKTEVILGCYDCMKKIAVEQPELFADAEVVRI